MVYRPTTSTRPHRTAFTLIEIAIVVTVTGTVMVLSLSTLSRSLDVHRMEAGTQRIATDIDKTRRNAIFTGAASTITFDLTNNRYTLTTDANRNVMMDAYQVSLLGVDFGGDAIVSFDGFGLPDSGGALSLTAGSATGVVLMDGSSGETSAGRMEIVPNDGGLDVSDFSLSP
jgi:hypothetical protein